MKFRRADDANRLKGIADKLSEEEGRYICRVLYKDPFKIAYPILLLIYIFILGGFLLWPFDFIFKVKNDAHWIGNSKGIEFLKTGQVISNSPIQELFNHLVKGSGLTIELWLETGDLNQAGPARIISYSKNKELCNFILAQAGDKLIVELRTTKTSLSGTSPTLVIPDIFSSRSLKHMIIMYDLSEQRVYINGESKAQSNVLKGDFSNWDPSCELVIGNEATGDLPWKGKIYYVAIFDRSLTEQEIHQNYVTGLQSKTNNGPSVFWKEDSKRDTRLKTKGLLLRYLFDERKGSVIYDSGSVLNPMNLYIPKYIIHKKNSFFRFSIGSLLSRSEFSDLILNVLIFIPLGILIHGMLRTRYGLALKISLKALLAGGLFSLGVESLQHFSVTRDSSLIDVFTNMIGVAVGIVMDRCYYLFLNYQAKRLQMLIYDRKE